MATTPSPDFADRPWTEEQWARFFEQADARSARYQELFETLMDHPERDRLIRREMGWREIEESEDTPWTEDVADLTGAADEEDEDLEDPPYEALEDAESAEEEQTDEPEAPARPPAEHERDVEEVPAYARTMAAAKAVHKALGPLLEEARRAGREVEDLSEPLGLLTAACGKIANGHSLGYEDQVLCGNIVQCRRALAATRDCAGRLEQLVQQRVLGPRLAEALLGDVRAASQTIEQHIAELRRRVWWA
jgi:hypothetical protein